VLENSFWSILDLAPTSDVTAIKKAYALKLKHNRPEDDALAFQRLNEARDQALSWVKYRGPKSRERAVVPATPSKAIQRTKPAVTPRQEADSPQQKSPALESVEFAMSMLPADELHDFIVWITDFGTLIQQEKVDAALDYIRSATFDQRVVAEERLLEAIESNFSKRVAQGQSHARLSWNDPFNDAILKLDAEFGWANRDRELANRTLGPDLIDYLNNLRSHDSIFAKPSVVIRKKFWSGRSWWMWAFFIYLAIKILALLASI
jgi:hypothetical protein